jgi:AcrR family transcriptional regulator
MPGVQKRVNRADQRAATRAALIDAAIELWSEAGWKVTSIAAVAERAGVTDAGLLHHFGTKQNFVLAVLAELDRQTLTYWETVAPTGLDLIRALPEMARRSEIQPGLWQLQLVFQAENLDPASPAYDYYRRRHHFLHGAFAEAVRTGQQQGEIHPDAQPDLVASQILAFLMGTGFHDHGPDDIDRVAVNEDFANRIIRDLVL